MELILITKLIIYEPHFIITGNDYNNINTYRLIGKRDIFRIKINNKYNNLIMNIEDNNLWHRRLGHFKIQKFLHYNFNPFVFISISNNYY